MVPSKESLADFIRIYRHEFGEDIFEDEASVMATQFLALYEAMYCQPPAWRKRPKISPGDV